MPSCWIKKGLSVAVILLFIGLAFAPSLTADLPETEIVEITDLAIADGFENTIHIFLGDGNGDFNHYNDYDVGSGAGEIVTEDFDKDGNLDLATVNDYTISVVFGDGKGGFSNRQDYNIGSWGAVLVACDLNNDAFPDIAATNTNDWTISVWFNDGSGGFVDRQDYDAGYYPAGITAGDFDEDGYNDLAVANEESFEITVLFNDGTGGFYDSQFYNVGFFPIDIVTDDFDKDGNLDLATTIVGDDYSGELVVLLGYGNGAFRSPSTYPVGPIGTAIEIGDYDSDGNLDLAIVKSDYDGKFCILFGDGKGSFSPPDDYIVRVWPADIVASDFDGDGDLDVAITCNDGFVTTYLGDGTGGFGNRKDFFVGEHLLGITSGEFNANLPPYEPSDPSPESGATDVPVNTDLQWSGGDPDPGDTVTYDVYLGTTSSPVKIVSNQSSTSYDPETMNLNTTYFWKIVAWDNHDNSVAGPIWYFTTEKKTNIPPNTPNITGPTSGTAGIKYDYNFETTDPDGNDVWYYIEWGDLTNTGWLGPYSSGEEITEKHTWSNRDTYTVRVKAKDVYDAESDWGTLEVTMPKNKIINPFERFLENHPYMFPILRQLLGL